MLSQAASADHQAAFQEARSAAASLGRPVGSADLLLGLLRAGGAAARLLGERGIAVRRLEIALGEIRVETGLDLASVEKTSHAVAAQLGAARASSMHLLIALLRAGGSAAELLRRAGHDPVRVGTMAMRALTGPSRIGERVTTRDVGSDASEPVRPGTEAGAGGGVPGEVAETPITAPSDMPSGAAALADTMFAGVAVAAGAASTPAIATASVAVPLPPPAPPALAPVELPPTPVLHRDREVRRVLDLLCAPGTRVICVVGEPGSGRSAVVAAAAALAPERPVAPSTSPIAGEPTLDWLRRLLASPAAAQTPIVLDGQHLDAPALAGLAAAARAGVRLVLTADPGDLARVRAAQPELGGILETVALTPLSDPALCDVLDGAMDLIGRREGVRFAPGLAPALARLAARLPSDRVEPGRAIALAGLAASHAAGMRGHAVTEDDVASVVSDATGIAASTLLAGSHQLWAGVAARLGEDVIGQEEACARALAVARRGWAGLNGERPLASLLLVGPPGCGKAEIARAFADALYGDRAAVVELDLGAWDESAFIRGVRRQPASVVLLRHLERAPREAREVLRDLLRHGRPTDATGRSIDLRGALVVMTSLAGSELYQRGGARGPSSGTVIALARSRLPAELCDAVDEAIPLRPLAEADLRRIAQKHATSASRALTARHGIRYEVDATVIDRVIAAADLAAGAHELRHAYATIVDDALAPILIAGRLREGTVLRLSSSREGAIEVTRV